MLTRSMVQVRAKNNGSPGRIRTSDMTVNSRPLYRLSYRGVFRLSARAGTTFDIRASMGNQVFIAQPAIIAGDRRYESNRIESQPAYLLGVFEPCRVLS